MAKKSVQMEDWNPDDENNTQETKPVAEKVQESVPAPPEPEIREPNPKPNPKMHNNGIYDVITGLPTDGKLYPEGTKIQGRTLKVQEIKMLSGMTEENANDIVNSILERTVSGIEPQKIYSADKLYIMFWLRANTFQDSGFNVKFECNSCHKPSEYKFELDQLQIKTLSEEMLENLNESFTLPNGDEISIGLMTVGDEIEVERFMKENANKMMNFEEDIVNLCKTIRTINGKKMGTISKYQYITDTLDAGNYVHLESYLEDKSVGLEPTVNVKCEKCGVASDTMLPFRPDFFLPKIRI